MIDHSELLPEGREIGGFRIDKAIGHGNMGIIYRAIQINLNRPVALKVLFKAVAEDQDFVRSFFREAQAAAAFTHQNIVQAFDVGQSDDGIYYFAMELIDGGDISLQLKTTGIYDPIVAVEKMLGVADGLDYGSTLRKLTHGDIKPANIMITKNGTFKLADLGLARMGGEIQGESDGIMLTPLYAAPEMINGTWEVGDPRADMYSLGATLYQMMYGEPPLNDDDYHKVIEMQLNQEHIPLKERIENFPSNISKLVDRFLEKDQEKRFESWGDAKLAMEAALKDPNGTHTKRKKKKIHYHQHKDEAVEGEPSHSQSPRSSHRRKKKSNAPVIISVIALLVIAGLGYFALNMKKDVVGNEYKTLSSRFEGKKPEAIIRMIENFVERQGATPPQAEKDLVKYRKMLEERSLFFVNDLSDQTKQIDEFEDQFKKKNPVVAENFRFNANRIESKLNSNLDTNGLTIHLPFNDSVNNHANFYSPPKITVNHGTISYVTAQVDKGIKFKGQSILYGDISRLRFSNKSKFTLSFWINPKLEDFPILGKCEISSGKISRGYLLSLVEGKIQADFFGNGDDEKLTIQSTKTLSLSSWNHVVLEYNGKTPTIFLNGLKAETSTLSETLKDDFSCTGPFVVGFKNMRATLDDIRVWSRALSSKELKELNNYRSISDLEKLTGRYQDIKEKIQGTKMTINSTTDNSNKDNEDVGPPMPKGEHIEHPLYAKFIKNLSLLKKFPGKWSAVSKDIEELCEKISLDIDEEKKVYFTILARSIRTAQEDFHSFLIENKELAGTQITHGNLKGYEIYKIDKNFITLKEKSPRLGSITHRYYWTEFRTNDALNGIISTMVSKGLYKDDKPAIYISAMIIGHKYHVKNFSDLRVFPKLIKGLYRDMENR